MAANRTTCGYRQPAQTDRRRSEATWGAAPGVRVPVEPSPSPLHRFRAAASLVHTVVNTRTSDQTDQDSRSDRLQPRLA
jgi:hypothetical protein